MCQLTATRLVKQKQMLGKRPLAEANDSPPTKFAKENEQETIELKKPTTIKLRGFLIACAQQGNLEKIVSVMENEKFEVDISEERMGCTALHYACFYNHFNIVDYLVSAGAPLDATTEAGRTPIAWAVEKKAYDIVGFLLEAEADPSIADKHGYTPLHIATLAGDYKMVEILLSINTETEEWTKVDATTNEGFTAASFAAHQGNLDILTILYECGSDFAIATKENKISPLHRAVSRGHLKIVRFLLENGANIDARDSLGRTALHLAVTTESKELVQLLLSFSPTMFCDITQASPLAYATARGNTELVQLLEHA